MNTDIDGNEVMATKEIAGATQKVKKQSALKKYEGLICLVVVIGLFYYLGQVMGLANMLNTLMRTAHDLLLNTVFYLMAICVMTGAIGRIFVESYRLPMTSVSAHILRNSSSYR